MPEKKKSRGTGIFMENIITRNIVLPFNLMGNNIAELILDSIKEKFEKKCVTEGYIKENSIRLVNYSSGTLNGSNIRFNVNFTCLICRPVEGMLLKVIVKNITKAGLKCETKVSPSPVIAFIARDHHNKSKDFANVQLEDEISVRVVGIRYELNDEYIALIGELMVNARRNHPKQHP
jgi:DNA-directed RNA polymerase subunit E'/Rpb7